MHIQSMPESEGKFTKESNAPVAKCPKCWEFAVYYKIFESNCGGFEDAKYTCAKCGHYWWIDGPDS